VYADIHYVFVPYLPLKGAFSTLNVHNSASMVHISTFWVLYCFVFLFIIILKMSTLSFLSQNRKNKTTNSPMMHVYTLLKIISRQIK